MPRSPAKATTPSSTRRSTRNKAPPRVSDDSSSDDDNNNDDDEEGQATTATTTMNDHDNGLCLDFNDNNDACSVEFSPPTSAMKKHPQIIDDDDEEEDNNNTTTTTTTTTNPTSPIQTTPTDEDTPEVFLTKLGIVTKPVTLNNAAEQVLYQLFADNVPRGKTAITNHTAFKSKMIKPKQVQQALEDLVARKILIQQDTVFYTNQDLLPSIKTDAERQAVITRTEGYKRQIGSLRTQVTAIRSRFNVIQNQQTTNVLEQEVANLEKQLREREAKLEILRTLSSDPEYLNNLRRLFANALREWRQRRSVALEISKEYLDTVQKKQRHWFKELGLELEDSKDSVLQIDLQEYVDYGINKGYVDEKLNPLEPDGSQTVRLGGNAPSKNAPIAPPVATGPKFVPLDPTKVKGPVVGKNMALLLEEARAARKAQPGQDQLFKPKPMAHSYRQIEIPPHLLEKNNKKK